MRNPFLTNIKEVDDEEDFRKELIDLHVDN